MPLENVRRLRFDDLDRARVQDEAIASALENTEEHLRRYRADPLSHGGRYVAADLFKETFAAYRASPATRNRYNAPIHNAAAVLSAEQLRQRLQDGEDPRQDTVLLLTGIPGSGKTTTVLELGVLSISHRAVFEGQLVKPETTFPKIQQVLDAGLKPVIVVAHTTPEEALRNTLRRFAVHGRGAGIGVMADIQAGLPAGLRAVRAHFGSAVALEVADYRDRRQARRLQGWENLPILESEGNHERITTRLRQELERLRERGQLGDDAERQALGLVPLARPQRLDGPGDRRHAPPGQRRDVAAAGRAQAFATLSQEQATVLHPELAVVYKVLERLRQQGVDVGRTAVDREAILARARALMIERLRQGLLPTLQDSAERLLPSSFDPER